MPREVAPGSYPDFREWWAARLASGRMSLASDARRIGYATAFEIPLPGIYAPASRLHNLIMLGSLPKRVRELYGLRFTPAHAAAFRAAVVALRGSRPLVPGPLQRGENTDAFDLVARTELRRMARRETEPVAG
jgi:uncharacterized protein (DUF2236 family)